MPTNVIRDRQRRSDGKGADASNRGSSDHLEGHRVILIEMGSVAMRVALEPTRTADRLLMMLPLFSTAEPWGDVVHFELPVEVGRDRSARVNARLGEVYLWAEENRLILPFGPTPISRPGEIRLPWPCNTIGRTLDDLTILTQVRPSQKVTLRRL